MQQTATAYDFEARIPLRWTHETGFHFDRHHAHVRLNTARSRGHAHIQQGHDHATMRHMKRIEVLRARREMQLGLAAFELFQGKTQMIHKRNLNAK